MEELPQSARFLESIKRLDHFSAEALEPSDEAPIFVAALGWGTGSTLLQRILMTDPGVKIWGEPYGRMGLIPFFTAALSCAEEGWPRPQMFEQPTGDEPASKWVANWYPDPTNLLRGIRSMILDWLAAPIKSGGYARWGIKEVRLGAADAHLLQRLFPQARFIVLARDPNKAYLSTGVMNVRWRFDVPVNGAVGYAQYWNTLAVDWLDNAAGINHRIIRHEDVVSRKVDFRDLESWLGINIRENKALDVVIGKKAKKKSIGFIDKAILQRVAGQSMKRLGYE